MQRRDMLIGGAALAITAGLRPAMAATGTFEVTRSDAEWRAMLSDLEYKVMREEGTERAFSSPLVEDEVRQRHRLAVLLAGVARSGRDQARPQVVAGANGSALPPLRLAPGPHLRRRTAAHRQAALPQRREPHLRPGLRQGARGPAPRPRPVRGSAGMAPDGRHSAPS